MHFAVIGFWGEFWCLFWLFWLIFFVLFVVFLSVLLDTFWGFQLFLWGNWGKIAPQDGVGVWRAEEPAQKNGGGVWEEGGLAMARLGLGLQSLTGRGGGLRKGWGRSSGWDALGRLVCSVPSPESFPKGMPAGGPVERGSWCGAGEAWALGAGPCFPPRGGVRGPLLGGGCPPRCGVSSAPPKCGAVGPHQRGTSPSVWDRPPPGCSAEGPCPAWGWGGGYETWQGLVRSCGERLREAGMRRERPHLEAREVTAKCWWVEEGKRGPALCDGQAMLSSGRERALGSRELKEKVLKIYLLNG